MVDPEIILAKAGAARKHIGRVKKKTSMNLNAFLGDTDSQDVILFNMQMAVQNCIDIAAHIISDRGLGIPGSNNEMFYLLEDNGFLDRDLTEKMVKAVGFRNLIVHEYVRLELDKVYQIAKSDTQDLLEFMKTIIDKLNIAS